MTAESCAYASGATRLLYVIATDCAVRLALRAGLRLAPSLSTTRKSPSGDCSAKTESGSERDHGFQA